MATYKGVYFCESDHDRWFETREEADQFDNVAEINAWVAAEFHTDFPLISSVVDRIMERYEITQRWDWKEPAEDVQE